MDMQITIWFFLVVWIAYLVFLRKSFSSKVNLVTKRLMGYDYRRWIRILQRRIHKAPKVSEGLHKLHHYYIISPEQLMRPKR